MTEWQLTPDGDAGEFEWKHAAHSTVPMIAVRLTGRNDSPLFIDAQQMFYLLRQMADEHGPEEVLKWLQEK